MSGVHHAAGARSAVVCSASTSPQLRQRLKQRQQEFFRDRLQQRQEDWHRWEQEAAFEEAQRRLPSQTFPMPQQGSVESLAVGMQAQSLTPAAVGPTMAPPSQTQRLQQQQQQFAAANQQVEQVQRAQDDQLAELQARMQKRVADRQKKSGRWLGGSASRMQQQQQQQQPLPQQPQQPQDAGAGLDLSVLARGGLQQKVARFASTVNFLQRSQQVRGAELSWGRREEAFGGEGAAEAARPGGTQGLEGGDWEQQLGVTRVRRQRGGTAGMDSLEAALEVEEDQSARRPQQVFDGWRSYGQAGVTAVAALEEQLDW
ncbi:hypothetical protein D9Q98_003942 [Chlorella vulgaris]|uniref:Uncharacterized protein n=1 Tax=Chlorella vulgaris TaxID=3077 RepID=A0A9D4YY31_CHLVU|nr:hypothetical protein D9Q98_003942 [Chlorella vulgaris]